MAAVEGVRPRGGSIFYDPRVRGGVDQIVVVAGLVALVYFAASNAKINLERAHITTGLDFLSRNAGFDINQTLISYSATTGTYGRAFLVGLLNTLILAAIGIVIATLLGFVIGVARLSTNWIVAKVASVYVELVRNVPLLLQLFFWYNAVLKPLPSPLQSLDFGGGFFLNNRRLFLPELVLGERGGIIPIVFLLGLIAAFGYSRWARRRQMATGQQSPVGFVAAVLIVGLPIVAYFAAGQPVSFNYPALRGFNFTGGMQIYPEFVAMLLGLSIYTAAFIAEIVRAGILAVSKGQTEAARSLGLRAGPTLRLVIIPQAMRVIVPPLTNQYLNLTKNSSLAVAIGYPDLVQVFAGTVLNQTGQAIEVIGITMAVYLFISLVTSIGMNFYNRRVAIVER